MSSPERGELPVINQTTIPCRHLRNKGMYVFSGGSDENYDTDHSTIFWCLQTMKSYGPDDEYVSGEDCRNGSRSCYEPL